MLPYVRQYCTNLLSPTLLASVRDKMNKEGNIGRKSCVLWSINQFCTRIKTAIQLSGLFELWLYLSCLEVVHLPGCFVSFLFIFLTSLSVTLYGSYVSRKLHYVRMGTKLWLQNGFKDQKNLVFQILCGFFGAAFLSWFVGNQEQTKNLKNNAFMTLNIYTTSSLLWSILLIHFGFWPFGS